MNVPFIRFMFFSFLLVELTSCNLINPDEEIPAYIEVKGIKTTSNYSTQGSASGNIKDVWVFADGAYLGTYELPAKFPVLLSGKQKISFAAGIEANGIASTNEFYPLYRFFETDVNLIPGQVSTMDTITVEYFPALQYAWFEDFEKDTSGGGISLDTTGISLANILPDSVDVFEGRRSLKMKVNATENFIECRTVGDGYLLTPGKDIYLEMNYRCNQPFIMGFLGTTISGEKTIPIIKLNTKPEWNKIYVRLGPYVNANTDVLKFKIYFRLALASGLTEGLVYLDNVKLISN